MKYIELTAHRGCKGEIPENTIPSFRAALDANIDYLEYDVHMSLDGVLVIMHDSLVVRTTGARGAIDFMSFEEIKALDAGYTLYGEAFRGTPVPTLRETLELVASYPSVRQVLEIKDFRAVVVDKIVEMLKEFNLIEKTIIEAGDAQVIHYLHKSYPEIELMVFPPVFMKRNDNLIYDFIKNVAIPINSERLKSEDEIKALIADYKKKGIKIWLFSGDNEAQIEHCLSLGADNITSNFPSFALSYLSEKGYHNK